MHACTSIYSVCDLHLRLVVVLSTIGFGMSISIFAQTLCRIRCPKDTKQMISHPTCKKLLKLLNEGVLKPSECRHIGKEGLAKSSYNFYSG